MKLRDRVSWEWENNGVWWIAVTAPLVLVAESLLLAGWSWTLRVLVESLPGCALAFGAGFFWRRR